MLILVGVLLPRVSLLQPHPPCSGCTTKQYMSVFVMSDHAHILFPSPQEQPLIHVISVFRRLGYRQGGQLEDWDVLWSHEYPFLSLPAAMWAGLEPRQKVNHFPGSGCFTFKPQLATMTFDFIPIAFQLPKHVNQLSNEVSQHRLCSLCPLCIHW